MLEKSLLLFLACGLVAQGAAAQPAAAPEATHVYRQAGGTPYALDVYYPARRAAGARLPALVFFHGGGWVGGNRRQFARQAAELGRKANLVVISADYPLQRDPAQATESAEGAVCWVRREAQRLGIDPARIAVAGASAGGQMAAAVALAARPSAPECQATRDAAADALVLFNPVLDLKGRARRFGLDLAAVSPIDIVDRRLPPTLILQGSEDRIAPLAVAERFVAKARAAGAREVRLVPYPGRTHGFFNRTENGDLAATLDEVVAFLRGLGWAV